MRSLAQGLLLATILLVAHGRADATPNEARIPLDAVGGIWVMESDGSFTSYAPGAPEVVNREFMARYVSAAGAASTPVLAPTPTPPPSRAETLEIGWWVVELKDDGDDTASVRSERLIARHVGATTLRLACRSGTFSVSAMVGWDGETWPMRHVRQENRTAWLKEYGLPPAQAGQIMATTNINRHGSEFIREWWNISPGYEWAFAPDPHSYVDLLRGNHSLSLGLSLLGGRSERTR